jgi:hypothetical protein
MGVGRQSESLRPSCGGIDGLNFAVPINYVRGMVDSVEGPMGLDELRAKLTSTKTDVFNQIVPNHVLMVSLWTKDVSVD